MRDVLGAVLWIVILVVVSAVVFGAAFVRWFFTLREWKGRQQ